MGHYIDVEKLIAEIERWRDKAEEDYNESTYSMGRCDALAEFRNHIVSLLEEQPEVDLLKALDDYYNKAEFGPGDAIEYETHKSIAHHFYELGLNARKEE